MLREELNRLRDDLFCEFCNKPCKNLNSLNQHSTRCKDNPNRKDFDKLSKYSTSLKGTTKYTSERVRKSAESLSKLYAHGYVSPLKGKARVVNHVYKDHNDAEILKWKLYISTCNVSIPFVQTESHTEGYRVLSQHQTKDGNTVKLTFEHDYVANILLQNNLTSQNTVHHIDGVRDNNTPFNLLIFIDNTNHKRFHNSDYAKLTYDEQTHLFSCEIVR